MFFDLVPETGCICAHRGARSLAPENTLLALETAMWSGAHCAEVDVRMSAEGDLIIFHDEDLFRTTSLTARAGLEVQAGGRIGSSGIGLLRSLDAGSWFLTADPFATIAAGVVPPALQSRMAGQRIPLLREVLALGRRYGFPLNLEIKDCRNHPAEGRLIEGVVGMLWETGSRELVLLSSFRVDYLHAASRLDPGIPLALLFEKEEASLPADVDGLQAAACHPVHTLCTPALIARLRRLGCRVNCWTVNDYAEGMALLAQGAGIITDWPQRFVSRCTDGSGTTVRSTCRRPSHG